RRKLRQECASRRGAGGNPALTKMLRTEVAATAMPSLRSSPARVLACEPQDQLAHVTTDRRPTRATVRVCPPASDQPSMPGQEAGHTKASMSSDTYGHVMISVDDEWRDYWLTEYERARSPRGVRHADRDAPV